MADVPAIFSLIQKQTRRIARSEIDAEPQMSFGRDCLQIFSRISAYEPWRFARFVSSRHKPCENALHVKSNGACPGLQLFEKPLSSQHSSKGEQHVLPKALHPAIFDGAETVCVGRLCVKVPKQHWINPPEVHSALLASYAISNRHRTTDRLPRERVLLHCRIT